MEEGEVCQRIPFHVNVMPRVRCGAIYNIVPCVAEYTVCVKKKWTKVR